MFNLRTILFLGGTIATTAFTGFAPAVAADKNITVKIEGLDRDLKNNVEAYLTIVALKAQNGWTEERLRRAHRRANIEIREALQPFGFYEPKIEKSLSRTDDTWIATYNITPGPPTLVGEVDISVVGDGRADAGFAKLITEFPLSPGQPLIHADYEKGKRALIRYALDQGYLDATFAHHEVAVSRIDESADITIMVNSGSRYRFGEVTYQQNVLDDDFIRRFQTFEVGDGYENAKLLELHNALYDSEYFSSIDARADKTDAVDLAVPILVSAEPLPRHRYTAGLGYGTDTGPRGSLGWTNRRVNRQGHRVKTQLRVSDVLDSLTATYAIPIRNPRSDQLELSTSWTDDRTGDQEDESFVYGIARSISRRAGWLETIYLNYRTDSYIIGEDQGKTQFLYPGITWTWIRAPKNSFPLSGYRYSIDVRGANENVLSDGTFAQTIVNGKFIVGLGQNSRLILRGEAGTTTFGDIRKLPPSLRFFTGGDLTVRGYAYNSLSPDDLGGEQLLVGSVEAEHRFKPNWSAAAFIDAGNAMNSWQAALMKGAGIGIRWHSPVGALRFDIAQALSEDGRPWKFHIVIGPVI